MSELNPIHYEMDRDWRETVLPRIQRERETRFNDPRFLSTALNVALARIEVLEDRLFRR